MYCVVPENIHTEDSGNSDGEGGFESRNFQGVEGCHGQLFFQRVKHLHEKILKLLIQSTKKNLHIFVLLKKKIKFLSIDLWFTSLALMFLCLRVLQSPFFKDKLFFVSKWRTCRKKLVPVSFPTKGLAAQLAKIKGTHEDVLCNEGGRSQSCCFRRRKGHKLNALQNL